MSIPYHDNRTGTSERMHRNARALPLPPSSIRHKSQADAIRSLVDSAGSIGMLVLHDRVLTVKRFPPDAAKDVAAVGDGGGGGEYDEEEVWGGMTPVQAVGFRSEVTESDDGEVGVFSFVFFFFATTAIVCTRRRVWGPG